MPENNTPSNQVSSPFQADSPINQAIASKLVETGFSFTSTTALEASKKEYLIRYWSLPFPVPLKTETTRPAALTLAAFYMDNAIRFWATVIANRKLTDSERVAISESIREPYRYARVSIDNSDNSLITVEADFHIDSVGAVTRGLLDAAISSIYHASLKIIADNNFSPS